MKSVICITFYYIIINYIKLQILYIAIIDVNETTDWTNHIYCACVNYNMYNLPLVSGGFSAGFWLLWIMTGESLDGFCNSWIALWMVGAKSAVLPFSFWLICDFICTVLYLLPLLAAGVSLISFFRLISFVLDFFWVRDLSFLPMPKFNLCFLWLDIFSALSRSIIMGSGSFLGGGVVILIPVSLYKASSTSSI